MRAPGSAAAPWRRTLAAAAPWLAIRGPGPPLLVEAIALAALGVGGDPAARPLRTLLLFALAAAALWALVGAVRRVRCGLLAVLAVAALVRALLLPLPPTLSADVWRYLWEGRVAAAGHNPYVTAPDHPALAALRDARWERVDHRQVPTVYPPLPLAIWSLVARLPAAAGLPAWKLIACIFDLVACWGLVRLATATGRPAHRVFWYAANPLVALEVAGAGHLEPLGIAAAVGAVLALSRVPARPVRAGLAAAAAGLAKLAPFAAVPMWARQSGRPARLIAAAGAAAALTLLPVAGTAGVVPAGLATYAVRWEFAGPLHEPLWRALAAARAPEAVEHALDLMKEWTGMHGPLNRLYPWAYPQLLSRLLLAVAALALVARSVTWRDPVRGTGALFGGLVLCSPTVYPWYLLWALPWAALEGQSRWLWLAAAAPLLYVPGLLGVPWWPWLHLALWGPFPLLWWRDRRCAGG